MARIYKVVFVFKGRYFSYNASAAMIESFLSGNTVHAVLEYKLGELAQPSLSGSLLFGFKSKRDAIAFLSPSSEFLTDNCVILECETDDPVLVTPDFEVPSGSHRNNVVAEFWECFNKGKIWDGDVIPSADKTCLVKSLTPIREVK